MSITAKQKYQLNNHFGFLANQIQLGSLIEAAESVVAGEIALADGKILIGNGSGISVANTMSGDATMTNAGVLTIADAAVSVAKMAVVAQPSHVCKYAGQHTTIGGAAAEVISVAGVLATDIVVASLLQEGVGTKVIKTVTPGVDTVTVTFDADPSNDHIVSYVVMRAVA